MPGVEPWSKHSYSKCCWENLFGSQKKQKQKQLKPVIEAKINKKFKYLRHTNQNKKFLKILFTVK